MHVYPPVGVVGVPEGSVHEDLGLGGHAAAGEAQTAGAGGGLKKGKREVCSMVVYGTNSKTINNPASFFIKCNVKARKFRIEARIHPLSFAPLRAHYVN